MGCRLSFTIMAASLGVVTPRVQTINNGPMAKCTGHLPAGKAMVPHSDKSFQTVPQVFDSIEVRSVSWPVQQLNDHRTIPVTYCFTVWNGAESY
ncbi:hypothetical protein TNCV_261221 [Trichonephila clavipes]|nr:hypothetical protein TNCV_261221 [Trichonephila clavipes]